MTRSSRDQWRRTCTVFRHLWVLLLQWMLMLGSWCRAWWRQELPHQQDQPPRSDQAKGLGKQVWHGTLAVLLGICRGIALLFVPVGAGLFTLGVLRLHDVLKQRPHGGEALLVLLACITGLCLGASAARSKPLSGFARVVAAVVFVAAIAYGALALPDIRGLVSRFAVWR